MMMIMEQLVEWGLVGETEVLGENLPQCHFVHHKSHMTWPGIEPGPPQTQPLTEVSTSNIPGGKGRPARGADNLTAICEPIVSKMWEPQRLTTLRAFTAFYRASFTFYVNLRIVWNLSEVPCNVLNVKIKNNDHSSTWISESGNYAPRRARGGGRIFYPWVVENVNGLIIVQVNW
jgi:hypothetical protein